MQLKLKLHKVKLNITAIKIIGFRCLITAMKIVLIISNEEVTYKFKHKTH